MTLNQHVSGPQGAAWPKSRAQVMKEQLDAVRKLHFKSPLYNLADDCEVCSDDDEAVQDRHERGEGAEGDDLCLSVVTGYACGHCSDVYGYGLGEDEPVTWPCDTIQALDGKSATAATT